MNIKKNNIRNNLLISSSLSSLRIAGFATCMVLGTVSSPALSAEQEKAKSTMPTVTVEADKSEEGHGYKPGGLSLPKYTTPLLDTPQTITVVPNEVIKDRGATSLRDIVKNVTGITAAAGEGGTPNGDNLNIRGFSARTDMFIDGIRDVGGYFRDSFNLEQVEVIKGPSSAYAGRGSTGGTINEVSKSAKIDNFNNADITLGTDNMQRLTADVNHIISASDGVAIRLNAMGHNENVAGRKEVENQRWGVAPSLVFGMGTDTRWNLSYIHQQEDNIPDYGVPYFNGRPAHVPRDNFYGFINRDYENTDVDMGTAKVEHDINDTTTILNILRYGRASRDNIVTPPRNPDFNADTVVREGKNRDSNDTILLNQTNLTKNFATKSLEHTLVSGIEVGRETSTNKSKTISNQSGNLFNPNPYDNFIGTIVPNTTTTTKAESIAAYVFDTIKINPQWEVSGGVRLDHFNAVTDISNGTHLEQTDDMPTWRTGVVYKPRDNGSIYASYGTSFNPSAEALALSTTTAAIDPEESQSYELGTKWDLLKKKLGLTAAIFRTEKTNARTTAGSGQPTVLEGEQRVDGFELGVTGQITEKWDIFAGYTFMTSEIETSRNPAEVGKEVNRTPNNSLSLWTTYQILPKVEIGGGASYVDERYSNDANTNEVPGFVTYDAMASYDINDNVDLRLNVTNIMDADYYDSVGGGHVIPGRGRTLMLTTGLKF